MGLAGFQTPAEVSSISPLEVWVKRETLVAILKSSLQAIAENRTDHEPDVTAKTHNDRLVRQRERFLEQLLGSADTHVFLAMYPSDPRLGA